MVTFNQLLVASLALTTQLTLATDTDAGIHEKGVVPNDGTYNAAACKAATDKSLKLKY